MKGKKHYESRPLFSKNTIHGPATWMWLEMQNLKSIPELLNQSCIWQDHWRIWMHLKFENHVSRALVFKLSHVTCFMGFYEEWAMKRWDGVWGSGFASAEQPALDLFGRLNLQPDQDIPWAKRFENHSFRPIISFFILHIWDHPKRINDSCHDHIIVTWTL